LLTTLQKYIIIILTKDPLRLQGWSSTIHEYTSNEFKSSSGGVIKNLYYKKVEEYVFMDKHLIIYDWDRMPVEIVIPNYEDVIAASCKVLSGDEVLTITYKDGSQKTYDSSDTRSHDYYDGEVRIPLEHLDEISGIPKSYDMLEHFGDTDAKIRIGLEALGDVADLIKEGKI